MSSGSKNTRKKILNAAWKLLEDKKGVGVRMGDIAKAANVSRQALYLHFDSKISLVSATRDFVDDINDVSARVDSILSNPEPKARLHAYVAFWAAYLPEINGLAYALYATRDQDVASAAAWQDCMGSHRDLCLTIIRAAHENGDLAPEWSIETATQLLFTMLSYPTWEQLTIIDGWNSETYETNMARMLSKSLFI